VASLHTASAGEIDCVGTFFIRRSLAEHSNGYAVGQFALETHEPHCVGNKAKVLTLLGLENFDSHRTLVSGASVLRIRGVLNGTMYLQVNDITVGSKPQQRDFAVLGDRKAVMVRVDALDVSTGLDEAELRSYGFTDTANMQTQYRACSDGKFTLSPYDGIVGQQVITEGATTVQLNVNIANMADSQIASLMMDELESKTGVSCAASSCVGPNVHVLLVIPSGFLAWAYVSGKISAYGNVNSFEWASSLSAQMHEVGHNLGLEHSGDGDTTSSFNEYGDQSGYMGYSYNSNDTPLMCYNPEKSWDLGWYSDRHHDALSEEHQNCMQTVSLVGVADYAAAGDEDKVVVRLDFSTASGDSLPTIPYYIGFNRASGINIGTQEQQNKVHIVSALNQYSWSKAGLGEGESYQDESFPSSVNINVQSLDLSSSPARAIITISSDGFDGCGALSPPSPPPPSPCAGRKFELELMTDDYGDDTSWEITGTNFVGSGYASNTLYNIHHCLDGYDDACTFKLSDSYSDGLTEGPGGYYKVFINDNLVYEYPPPGQDPYQFSEEVTGICPSPPPSPSPPPDQQPPPNGECKKWCSEKQCGWTQCKKCPFCDKVCPNGARRTRTLTSVDGSLARGATSARINAPAARLSAAKGLNGISRR